MQELKIEEMNQVLFTAPDGMLGLCDSGRPYCLPFGFVWADDTLYLSLFPSGRKWACLQKDPQVCFTVYSWNEDHTRWSSVMIEGELIAVTELSEIEVKHQERIYKQYTKSTDTPLSKEEFVNNSVAKAVEGGMTTQEYIDMFKPDMESTRDILEIAMSIEAQALDLYSRASERSTDSNSKAALSQIADEERTHLDQLGQLMDNS